MKPLRNYFMINSLRKYHKWRSLNKDEQSCVMYVLVWLSFWLLITQITPFRYWINVLKKTSFPGSKSYSARLILKCILHCQSLFPSANLCLIQALIFWSLLDENKDVCFVIGVQKNEKKMFEAHAWIEYQTEIIIGKRPFDHFIPIWRYLKE